MQSAAPAATSRLAFGASSYLALTQTITGIGIGTGTGTGAA